MCALKPVSSGGMLFFLLAFDPVAVPDPTWVGLPRAWAFEPRALLRLPAETADVPLTRDKSHSGQSEVVCDEAYLNAVRAALKALHSGRLEKIVLARRKEWSNTADLDQLLTQVLAVRNSFRIMFSPDGESIFLSVTPERLACVMNGTAVTAAIAGTALRGANNASDDDVGRALAESCKEEEEHAYVVNMIQDALSGISSSISVGERKMITLPHVHHLKTDISAQLHDGVCMGEVVALLHPTPAVAGLPREAAMSVIAELEGFDRGLFAGAVGWIDAVGDGDAAVTIRSALLHGRRAAVYAGAGIVRDSDPLTEHEETAAKMRMVLDVLQSA
jgi:isochorismate synthase